MSTIMASYRKLAHGRDSENLMLVALLILAAMVLIVGAIMTTLSAISPRTQEADLLPLVRQLVVPERVPMPPAGDLQPSLAATPAPPVQELASAVIPPPMPVPSHETARLMSGCHTFI